MTSGPNLFRKWRGWLTRIYEKQLAPLLIHQCMFHQLTHVLIPYHGTCRATEMAQFVEIGHVAFATTRIRCMVEAPSSQPKPRKCPKCNAPLPLKKSKANESISLTILLSDLKTHHEDLTLSRFQRMYPRDVRNKAPSHFDDIAGTKGAQCIPASRIQNDICELGTVAKPVRRLANKVVVHTERDRQRRGRAKYDDLDAAIDTLSEIYKRYALLLNGSHPKPLVCLDDYDVTPHLRLIWPDEE